MQKPLYSRKFKLVCSDNEVGGGEGWKAMRFEDEENALCSDSSHDVMNLPFKSSWNLILYNMEAVVCIKSNLKNNFKKTLLFLKAIVWG